MTAQIIVAFAFGVAFVVTLIVLAIAFPRPTPFQYSVFRIVLALAGAGVAAMIPGFIDLQIAPVAGFLIRSGGALAVFVIVYFFNPAKLAARPAELESSHESLEQKNTPPPHGKLRTRLFVALGNGHLGPIDLTVYVHHEPSTLASQKMDGPLQLPPSMRTNTPRKVFWVEGNKFLEPTIDYWTQGVRGNATLVLTDQTDPQVASALADVIAGMGP
jgi:hypothetical protein